MLSARESEIETESDGEKHLRVLHFALRTRIQRCVDIVDEKLCSDSALLLKTELTAIEAETDQTMGMMRSLLHNFLARPDV